MHRFTRISLIGSVLFALTVAGPASAATVTVKNTADSGAGSLRDALAAAAPNDTITFGLPLPATITLTTGELLVDKDLTIEGPGPSLLTVRRDPASDIFRVWHVSHVTAAISGLTISDGKQPTYNANGYGGGILNEGVLTLTNVVVAGNTGNWGAGIWSTNQLTLVDSAVVNNTSNDFSGHGPGGVGHEGSGGAITLIRSLIAGNTAPEVPWATAMMAYSHDDTIPATVHVVNSTIDGSIANEHRATHFVFEASTVAADVAGGYPLLWNTALDHTTSVTYHNSILENRAGGSVFIGFSFVRSLGYNILSSGPAVHPADRVLTDALLGPLQDNGGPTMTLAPQPDSPAIDAGICSDADGFPLTTDQRGSPRPRGRACDIGAVEAASVGELQLEQVAKTVSTQLDVNVGSRASQESVTAIKATLASLSTAVGDNASQASVDALGEAMVLQGNTIIASVGALVPGIQSRASQLSVNDLSSVVAGVGTNVTALAQNVATQTQVTGLAAAIEGLQTGLGGLPTQASIDAVQGTLSALSASVASKAGLDALSNATTRIAVERGLSDGVAVIVFMLPASAGGYLDVVRQVVSESIAGMRLVGVNAPKAAADFTRGETAYTAGDYRTAYAWYASAYQRLMNRAG